MTPDALPWIIVGAGISTPFLLGIFLRNKQIEAMNMDSELRYQRLFETAQDGILILDAVSGKIVDANPYILELLGYPIAEIKGKQLWKIGVFKDIATSKTYFLQLQTDEFIHYETLPLQTKDGRVIDVEFVSNIYSVNGTKFIQCNIRDIVERKKIETTLKTRNKELEELSTTQEDTKRAVMNIIDDLEEQTQELKKFQMAVADSSDQIIISNSEGVVLYANQATENTTGYSVKEVIGTKAGSLWGGHMEKGYYHRMWETIKDKKQSFIAQIDNKRKNGQSYTAEIHVSPMIDDSGKPEYFVSIEHDITKEREIDKAKTEFVSLASHQLRTPLGIAKWYLEALKDDEYFKQAPETTQAYFEEIYQSNERVLSLVRDLLSVSRIDQGRTKNKPELNDISQLVKNSFKEMNVVALKKKIKLRIDIKPTKLPKVSIDPLRFHEVLENLISNALEYTKTPGSVTVTLSKLSESELQISVIDTGIGMSTATQQQLFIKFFRSEKAISINPDGSGLGLYVVKSYVEEWGGKVLVESKDGKGSNFTITIPINLKMNLKAEVI